MNLVVPERFFIENISNKNRNWTWNRQVDFKYRRYLGTASIEYRYFDPILIFIYALLRLQPLKNLNG